MEGVEARSVIAIGCKPGERVAIESRSNLQSMDMRRDGDCSLPYSEGTTLIRLVISGGEIGTASSFYWFGRGGAVVVFRAAVVATAFDPVESRCINCIDPDDGGLLLDCEVEHGSRSRTDIPSVAATSIPPLLGPSAVVEHGWRGGVRCVGWTSLCVHHVDVRIDLVIEV